MPKFKTNKNLQNSNMIVLTKIANLFENDKFLIVIRKFKWNNQANFGK
jgi:hypothetical protein